MNAVFTVILSVSALLLTVNAPESLLPAFLKGAAEALEFTFVLFGSYSLWIGVIGIMNEAGVGRALAKIFKPVMCRLFPGESNETLDNLTLNITANMLGTGGAATPAGIKAMEGMRSTRNATMLVVLNSTSLQIIPTTVLAMRASAGATSDILLPSLLTSAVTTFLAIIAVNLFTK